MQYLITTFTDSTGIPHNHVTKARENQTFTVVEAESKEEATKIYEEAEEMRVKTDKEELDINLQGDILISKYGINIDNTKNEEEKITFLKNTVLFRNPIKRWYLRNIKYNLTSTLLLIKWYWKH